MPYKDFNEENALPDGSKALQEDNKALTRGGTSRPGKKNSDGFHWKSGVDRPFLFLLLILIALGVVMVFTASYSFAQNKFGDSFYFSKRQLGFALGGLFGMLLISRYATEKVVKMGVFVAVGGALLANVGVLIYGVAKHGALRWIRLGPIEFQPSEVLKFAAILFCALLSTYYGDKMKTWKKGVWPFACITVVCLVILYFQDHLSAMIITTAIIVSMMILGGCPKVAAAIFGGTPIVALFFVVGNINKIVEWDFVKNFFANHLTHVYKRLLVWTDPFKYMRDEATSWAGWQPSQSIYAISSGGVWGVGLGQSMQKHGYLPEPQNDYIFSILCEEFGFVGAVTVILLFAALILRGFYIARNCRSRFCQLVVYGLMIKLGLQVIFNIGVVTGTLPSTGISLPFFSYGGTSLIMTMAEMGIVLSFSRYSYTERGEES